MSFVSQISAIFSEIKKQSVIQWPKPVAIKLGTVDPSAIPDLASADGAYWIVSAATFARYSATGTLVYSIAAADLNASVTNICAVYIDYTAAKVFLIGKHGADNYNFADTALATNTLSARGTVALTTPIVTTGAILRRITDGSGNFNLYLVDANTVRKTTITESTGAMTAYTNLTTGGLDIRGMNYGTYPRCYISADEKIIFAMGQSYIGVNRGGITSIVTGRQTSADVDSRLGVTVGIPVPNGRGLTLLGSAYIARQYNQAEFLAFMHKCADAAGCPK